MQKPSPRPFPLAVALALGSCNAGAVEQAQESLVDFSLEQLGDIVVTSVSRRETRLADAPASIYSIGGAEIRRAGATSLPEALRLAPNLQVARADAHSYAITARGFGSPLENKLLVLIDGRSVYSPLFSGVFWDMQDVLMEDIERIEVISGPGATIWGANAVNGVINIITRSSADTQGGLLVAGAGNVAKTGALRYGGKLANGGHYRLYGQYSEGADTEAGAQRGSGWQRRQAGFRTDWSRGAHELTVSGDVAAGTLDAPGGPDTRIAGANLLGRFVSRFSDGSEVRLQAYLDHTERAQTGNGAQLLDTADFEVQRGAQVGLAHRVAWGAGYRYSRDQIENGPILQFSPAERRLRWGNVFLQDEIGLRAALQLTLGIKFEHNSYTGWEVLPNVHLARHLDGNSLLWAGASRTVRAPSRIDRDLWLVDPRTSTPAAPRYLIAGGAQFDSEVAKVLELGYRGQAGAALTYAATLYYSRYERLRTLEPAAGQGAMFGNLATGASRGLEMWGRWQAAAHWRLTGGLVLQDISTRLLPDSLDVSAGSTLGGNDPSRYCSLRSSHDLADDVQADFMLRHVGSLPQPALPAYTELDARLAWQPRRNMELSLAGQNLLRRSHPEFAAAALRQVFGRSVALKLALRF